ncbi:hypothetical protein M3Y98_00309700 [Aphelenchoides besseyi]|nr:hypothetical protein M3Y98_00309700 [Aphelenchoides besseyi]
MVARYNPLMYDNLNGYGLYGANFLNNPFMDASIYTNPTLSGLNALGAMNGLDNFGTLNGLSGFPTFNVQNPIGANTNFGSTRLSGIDQLNLGNPIASYNAGRTHRLPSATRLQGAVTGCANLDYRPCQTEEYKTRGAGTIWENTRDFH